MITIKFRRDFSYDWERANPVLADGEPGYEHDTGKFKIGDGKSRWADLGYFVTSAPSSSDPANDEAVLASLAAHIKSLNPHPVYDDGPSLLLLYQNAKV